MSGAPMNEELETVKARLMQTQRQLEQQRAWKFEIERDLAAAKREIEDLRGQLFAARDKIAGLERAREWASGERHVPLPGSVIEVKKVTT